MQDISIDEYLSEAIDELKDIEDKVENADSELQLDILLGDDCDEDVEDLADDVIDQELDDIMDSL